MHSFIVIFIILYSFDQHQFQCRAQNYPYRHYSRQSNSGTIYDNQTLLNSNDDGSMCHLSVRCPNAPLLREKIESWDFPLEFVLFFSLIASYDRDNRNRRFTVDTFLAMHGPPGPPGLSGPMGNPGLRGAVGPQGKYA